MPAQWGYRLTSDGQIEKQLFPDGRPEDEGWHDSPAAFQEPPKFLRDASPPPADPPKSAIVSADAAPPPVKRRRGRPRKRQLLPEPPKGE